MARSDRPLPPRVSPSPEIVVLDSLPHGEWNDAVLTGMLADDFDEPLLLARSRVERATLVGASLAGSRLVDVMIDGCDLSGADLAGAALTRVEVRNSKLAGVQLAQSRWHDVRFIDCQFDGANLRFVRGEFVRFERCRLHRAELRDSVLTTVAWWDCDLTDADVSNISVARAQLHGSDVSGLVGATSLVPIVLGAQQAPAFAEHFMATLGIVVADRADD